MRAELDYWTECIANAAEEAGLPMSAEQLKSLAECAQSAHENYGMSFYSPPASDRIADIERQHKTSLERLEKERDTALKNAATAIKQALGVHPDDNVSIGEYGEVLRHGGRTERIQ